MLVVDDHPTVGAGTKFTLEQQIDITADVIDESDKVMDLLDDEKYDVYLVDLYMPNLNGIELTKKILRKDPEAIILMYTGYDIITHYNFMMDAGISGFVSKTATSEQLITAIRCALREEVVIPLHLLRQLRRGEADASNYEAQEELSGIGLSEREQQVLELVGQGSTNTAISLKLNVSKRTVESDLTKVFSKLRVSSRTEAYKKAWEFGLLSVGKLKRG